MSELREERVFWREVFHAHTFDFRGRINFIRFDGCTFVQCTLLIDQGTEQLAFTGCTFKDCNITGIDADGARGILTQSNFFDRPIEERRLDFEKRLAAARSAHQSGN
jgi:hypothetical protein